MDANQITQVFNSHVSHKFIQKNTSASYRIAKLEHFRQELLTNSDLIKEALNQDFGKAGLETMLSEIMPLVTMINRYRRKLKGWMKPHKVSSSYMFTGTKAYISYEAKGNCLVISPWNYPLHLALYPVLTSFAAGNTTILKPSEFTPQTNKIIKQLIEKVFLPEEIVVIEGEVETSTELLKLPFDHIFFTGSTPVGKIIMEKASQHLASVALELGGKSPVLVDKDFDLEIVAKNIAWGKLYNGGQTCVAPDYLLLFSEHKENFIKHLQKFMDVYYGGDYENNNDYCRIITHKHAVRLKSLIDEAITKGAKLEFGGEMFANGKVEPTVLTNVTSEMGIMQEEIFGPVLPILSCESLEEMKDTINKFDNPLSLYMFSYSKDNIEYIRQNTNSGGFGVNETLLQVAHAKLPFGGAGKSGIGNYHGKWGFEEMSNLRSVLQRKFSAGTSYFYPPYTEEKEKITDWLVKKFNRFL